MQLYVIVFQVFHIAGDYTSFRGQGDENHPLETGFFVHQRIVSAVKRANCLTDMMSYIVLRGLWCNIIVLNARALTEEKNDDSKNRFYGSSSRCSIIFLSTM
jgi:hypothetical protein